MTNKSPETSLCRSCYGMTKDIVESNMWPKKIICGKCGTYKNPEEYTHIANNYEEDPKCEHDKNYQDSEGDCFLCNEKWTNETLPEEESPEEMELEWEEEFDEKFGKFGVVSFDREAITDKTVKVFIQSRLDKQREEINERLSIRGWRSGYEIRRIVEEAVQAERERIKERAKKNMKDGDPNNQFNEGVNAGMRYLIKYIDNK